MDAFKFMTGYIFIFFPIILPAQSTKHKVVLRWIFIHQIMALPDHCHHVCHSLKHAWCSSSFAVGRSSELISRHCNARSFNAQLNVSGIEGGSLLDAICKTSKQIGSGKITYKPLVTPIYCQSLGNKDTCLLNQSLYILI